jgi:hypothetical protein
MMDVIRGTEDLNPNSVSPVLKTQIMITLDSDFPFSLRSEDFSVNATSTSDETYVKYLSILSVVDTPAVISEVEGSPAIK